MSVNLERLQRLLGQPGLERLIERLRQRFEAGGTAQGTLTLGNPDATERLAIEQLLGRPPGRGGSLQIRLELLEQVLRATGAAPDLYSAIAALSGPIRDRQADRDREQAAWRGVFEGVREPALGLGLAGWLDGLEASGLPRSSAIAKGKPTPWRATGRSGPAWGYWWAVR